MTIDDGSRQARPTAHELARYERLFADRTRGMRSSAMREMMALTERPDVISLAGGLPDTSTFPPEVYAQLMAHVAAKSTARALQYGPTEGMAVTMECIVEVMAEEGTSVDAKDLIVTTGGQQVIDLVCKTLLDPGDVVVAEAPTYPGAVPTFGAYQADVVQIEMDGEGMPIDELEDVLDRLRAAGRHPKFIYTIPNFQNPGGVTMSLGRRRRLVQVARERELLILEDNPYGLLRYEGEPLPTLYSLDAANAGKDGASDFVIYLGTFSKILSPGLRLGWAVAPRPVLAKLNLGKQGTDLCSSPVTQLFVAAYFAERDWREYLGQLKQLYRRRRDVMLEALTEHFGGRATWTRPDGGLFIWATLGGGVDTTDLLARAEGVAFVPGRAAYMDGRSGASSMRLNFAGVPEELIREGIRRIGATMGGDTGLFGALSGSPSATPTPDADKEARTAATGSADESAGTLADVLELPLPEHQGKGRRRQGQ
ncbi:MAG TPA: PLP-dependent aminotransferase family protein [Solirubrobacteraceae bacterium]|jgi:2-aminoadipate transaminase